MSQPATLESVEKNIAGSIAEAQVLVDESKARIIELNAQIEVLTNKKTSVHTTITEVLERYPGMENEIDQEIANFEFKK